MKIGIISDTHDRIDLTKKVIQKLEDKKCKALIHCGDFCAPFILEELSKFKEKVFCCFGNTDDRFNSTKTAIKLGINLEGDIGEIEIGNKKIAFCHFPNVAENFAMSQKYDIVFHGHTHKKREEKIGNTLLVNPGEIMGRYGKSTYAIYDTKANKVEFFEL